MVPKMTEIQVTYQRVNRLQINIIHSCLLLKQITYLTLRVLAQTAKN